MPVTVRDSIVIDRPVEEVWAYLEDPTHDSEWRRPALKRLERLGAGPVGPGTRYQGVVAIGPRQYPYSNEVTEYEPPTRVAWKGISSTGWMIGSKGSYSLERVDGRTRMNFEITVEPNTSLGLLAQALVRAMGPRSLGPILKQLKQAVERQGS
jgi:uncharacterized protein YndB with AHSA1/START domain